MIINIHTKNDNNNKHFSHTFLLTILQIHYVELYSCHGQPVECYFYRLTDNFQFIKTHDCVSCFTRHLTVIYINYSVWNI